MTELVIYESVKSKTAGVMGINILALQPFERTIEDKATGVEEVFKGINFKTVSVFDISQTEGEELPSIAPGQLKGEEGEELYRRLDDLAEREGLKVTHYDLLGDAEQDPSYNGYYLPGVEADLRQAGRPGPDGQDTVSLTRSPL